MERDGVTLGPRPRYWLHQRGQSVAAAAGRVLPIRTPGALWRDAGPPVRAQADRRSDPPAQRPARTARRRAHRSARGRQPGARGVQLLGLTRPAGTVATYRRL